MKTFQRFSALLSLLLLFARTARAGMSGLNIGGSSSEIIYSHSACGEVLDPYATYHQVEPWFRSGNPQTPEFKTIRQGHKSNHAFVFSADGEFVNVRHAIYPDSEQLTFRSLATGEKLSSVVWHGTPGKLSDLASVAFDGTSLRIVGLAESSSADQSDSIFVWDGKNNKPLEKIEIQPPEDRDYVPVEHWGNNQGFRTKLTLSHPYYVRTELRTSKTGTLSRDKEFSAQIIDWENEQKFVLYDASLNYLSVIRDPFNSRYRYVAVLQNDEKSVQIIPFDRLLPAPPPAPEPMSLVSQMWQFASLLPGSAFKRRVIADAPPSIRDAGRTVIESNIFLRHTQAVKKVELSTEGPYAVTQTDEGLHIWNTADVREVSVIKSIPGATIRDFRVLEQMGAVAYTDQNDNLYFTALRSGEQIGRFADFSFYNLKAHIENRAPGVAYVTLDDGMVNKIVETTTYKIIPEQNGKAGSIQVNYVIRPTALLTKVPPNQSYRTEVNTGDRHYLVQIYEESSLENSLVVEVYSSEGGGHLITTQKFPMNAFQSDFRLSPAGDKVIYTVNETETGILHLDRLLKEMRLANRTGGYRE